MLGANQLCVHMFLWKRWTWQMYQIKSCMRYVKLFTPWLNQFVWKLLVAKWLCIKKTSNLRKSACNKGFTLCSAADNVCITTVILSWLHLVVVVSFQLLAFYAVSTPGVQIATCVPYINSIHWFTWNLNVYSKEGLQQPCNLEKLQKSKKKCLVSFQTAVKLICIWSMNLHSTVN